MDMDWSRKEASRNQHDLYMSNNLWLSGVIQVSLSLGGCLMKPLQYKLDHILGL